METIHTTSVPHFCAHVHTTRTHGMKKGTFVRMCTSVVRGSMHALVLKRTNQEDLGHPWSGPRRSSFSAQVLLWNARQDERSQILSLHTRRVVQYTILDCCNKVLGVGELRHDDGNANEWLEWEEEEAEKEGEEIDGWMRGSGDDMPIRRPLFGRPLLVPVALLLLLLSLSLSHCLTHFTLFHASKMCEKEAPIPPYYLTSTCRTSAFRISELGPFEAGQLALLSSPCPLGGVWAGFFHWQPGGKADQRT